ncbi:unnamed protein product [Calypogeia fissa]
MTDQGKMPLNRIWSWGAGTHGQLASGDFNDHLEPLELITFAEESGEFSSTFSCPTVLDMAGGGAHAVAVLGPEAHGQVVTWGNGQSGALGHGDESDLSIPKLVKFFQAIPIRSVAAGWSHTAFVSYSGELYTTGNGSFGQLGHGDFKARSVPSKVKTLPCKAVSMVACGMRHTLVLACGLSGEHEVYAFGSCKRGQLGLGALDHLKTSQPNFKSTGKVSVPQRIIGLDEHQIVFLAANGDHSAALSEDGSLHLWGRGFNGSPDDFVPLRIGNQLPFSKVALGWNHGIALADGQLWVWGSNDRGQLGIVKESASESTSVDVHSSSSVTTKGQDDVGTSTPGNDGPQMTKVVGLEENVVRWLSAGAEHSAVVLDDGRIMAWGWGEHGQLGLGTVEDQLWPTVVSIPLEGQVRWRTFCGSGFTFAVAEQRAP